MRILLKCILPALKDQLPWKRLFRNFFITRNGWGLFSKSSHISKGTGKLKVRYNTKKSALRAAEQMSKKYHKYYNAYHCLFCVGFHIGSSKRPFQMDLAVDKPS